VADPASWERLADFEQSNGRSELFEVAWRMWQDHPVIGVGLGDFRVHSSEYARALGPLEFAEFLTEERKYVHNVYLEILAETGIVGLLLFTTVLALCLRAAWRAVRLFRQAGDTAMATLAKAVVIGVVAWLAAGMFISGQTDRRLWLLLALGPAMLAAAKRQAGAYAVEGSRARPRRMGYARRHTP
jgi:O-antigen ligase